MDFVSSYKQNLTRKAAEDDDYVSEADSTMRSQISEQEVPDYADLMGADDVETKGDPVRGRWYFLFNLCMIIVLSSYVMLFSDWKGPSSGESTPTNDAVSNTNSTASHSQ